MLHPFRDPPVLDLADAYLHELPYQPRTMPPRLSNSVGLPAGAKQNDQDDLMASLGKTKDKDDHITLLI